MNNTGLLVADRSRARLFVVVPADNPRGKLRLVERVTLVNQETKARGRSGAGRVKGERNTNRQAGPVHPIGAQRERHRLEHERRFCAEVVEHALQLTADWDRGVMVLIAEPRLLSLMRERLRTALRSEIKLEELAKDYSGLSTTELERVVVGQRLIL
ncbi:MAG: host attachment protein [Betaproteobacteria bacterium]|nr:host attachment protein [Betaproteobacteria bacterium]